MSFGCRVLIGLSLTYFLHTRCVSQVVFPDSPKEWINHVDYLDSIKTDKINRHIFYDRLINDEKSFQWIEPEARLHFNSNRPFSVNDGASWRGRGLTSELSLGAQYANKFLRMTLAPILTLGQNASFQNSPILSNTKNEWNYQFNAIGDIDYVTRYGINAFALLDWGQSELSLFYKKLSLGLSSQNLQIGPAQRSPILLGQQAAGMQHVSFGLSEYQPLRVKGILLGEVKANLYYGRTRESEFFDEILENDNSYFNALTFNYVIPYVETIKIGINRVFQTDMQYFQATDLTRTFAYFVEQEGVVDRAGDTINDYFDQMGSVFVEWWLKESGMRFYVEFAKNDFFGNFRDLIVDPEHARGYTIGLDKLYTLRNAGRIVLGYETTNLARTKSFLYRPNPSFYTHFQDVQGYTNNGQLLGSWIGPGGSIHTASIAYLKNNNYVKIDVERIQVNDDYFLETFGAGWPQNINQGNQSRRYATFNFLVTGYKETERIGVAARLGANLHLNEYYIEDNDVFNFVSSFSLVYKINRQ